jgi:hypothetical protein
MQKIRLTRIFYRSPFLTILNSSVNIEEDLLQKQYNTTYSLRFLNYHDKLDKHKVEYPRNMSNESMRREILHTALFEIKRYAPEHLYQVIENREN